MMLAAATDTHNQGGEAPDTGDNNAEYSAAELPLEDQDEERMEGDTLQQLVRTYSGKRHLIFTYQNPTGGFVMINTTTGTLE